MFILTSEHKQQIKAICQNRNQEVGGFIDSQAIELPNQAKNPVNYFASYVQDLPKVIFHSHLISPEFSDIDIYFANKKNITLVLYCVATDTFSVYIGNPSIKTPLLNRPYIPNVLDSTELVKDYYAYTLNLSVVDNRRLIENQFVEVNSIQKHDIIIADEMIVCSSPDNYLVHLPFKRSYKTNIKPPKSHIIKVLRHKLNV
jgi:proteasome lid subunit RPN8/RPN11